MPMRAARITSCCGQRLPHGVRCVCAQRRKAALDKQRPTARARGYDKTWETAAAAFLAEPGNERCECGAPAVLVRHIKSIRLRPDLRMARSNWKPGCVRCNALDSAVEKRA